MPDARRSDSASRDGAETPLRPTVAALHVADGTPLDDATTLAEVLTPPAKTRRSREGEKLFFLFSPTGDDVHRPCRELREVVRETYWSTSGSVTAALRRTISVANRYLFEHNLNADRSERCYGGLACAVLSGRDLFLLQAGPVWACVLQAEELRCFPRGEKLAHMGIGPTADVRLHHVFAGPDDSLLLAPYALLRGSSEEGLRQVLSLGDVKSIAAGLRRMGGDEFAALVIRWDAAPEPRAAETARPKQARRPERPSRPARATVRRQASRVPVDRKPQRAEPEAPAREVRRIRARSSDWGAFWGKVGRGLGRGLRGAWRHVSTALGFLWHGLAAVGAGVLALGGWIVGAMGAAVRSTLPGTGRVAHRRARSQPPPEENRTVMTIVAIAIPIVVLVLVLIAYRQFAAESRLQAITNRAKDHIALAQAAEPDSEEARLHWERAMEQIEKAAALTPEDPSTEALQDQVQEALDELDAIQRLSLTQLADFGSSSGERRLVLTDQTVFVLDAAEGWVAGVSLDQNGEPRNEGTAEQGQPVLVRTGQRVEGTDVGQLIDCVWLGSEGGRHASALLVLEEAYQLVSYDPAWRSEAGEPQLARVALSSPPPGRPIAVGSYRGQFYILDAAAENGGQIWRYKPEGNAYPAEPERYFAAQPAQSLDTALDMAIDGHIYVLHENGTVEKFLGGESQPFEIRDVPKGLGEVSGFAVDPGGDGTVYLADRGNARIVEVGPEGEFKSQLRAWGALGALEAVAVNQGQRELYVLDDGKLYVAPLP